jgi:hypothetical protein
MGLNEFSSSYELCPGLGMNTTLTFCQALGTKLKAKQAVSILHSGTTKVSIPCCKERNPLTAHLIFSSVITDDAIIQSSVDRAIGLDWLTPL